MDYQNKTVGDIAVQLSGATKVFRKNKLDFCCGGGVLLTEAASEKGLDFDTIVCELKELEQTQTENPDWQNKDLNILIEHILKNFHEKHRYDLPELIKLAQRIEIVHGNKELCPTGLMEFLVKMEGELESHMQKEEQILFPAIKNGMFNFVSAPIEVMRQEHDEHGKNIERLEKIVHNFELPDDACNTWRACYLGVRNLIDDLMNHISLENNVLFPRALNQ